MSLKLCHRCGYSFKTTFTDSILRDIYFTEEEQKEFHDMKENFPFQTRHMTMDHPTQEICDKCVLVLSQMTREESNEDQWYIRNSWGDTKKINPNVRIKRLMDKNL